MNGIFDFLWAAQQNLPYTSAAIPGVGGLLKSSPEDFIVEEIPSYEPVGHGEHLFLWIEKQGVAAKTLLNHVARGLNISRDVIGCAGLKDTRAVTRQYLSVPAQCEAAVAGLNTGSIRVISSARHTNKLKTGHLRGNRFSIRLHGVSDAGNAELIVEYLKRHGVPNYYGAQRFGFGGETLNLGLSQLLLAAPRRVDRFLLRLALSAVQSAIFNLYLQQRFSRGLLEKVIHGDVMLVAKSGGPFWADEVAVEQGRYEAREIVPSGPMWGAKMRDPKYEAAEFERAILESSGLNLGVLTRFGDLMAGTRRPLVVWPEAIACEQQSFGLHLAFDLPKGSYATVVMRELMKNDKTGGDSFNVDEV